MAPAEGFKGFLQVRHRHFAFAADVDAPQQSDIMFHLPYLAERLQVFQNKRTVYGDLPQRRTSIHLRAVRACSQCLFPDAVMYGAELVAEGRFCALYATAGAVDHFR